MVAGRAGREACRAQNSSGGAPGQSRTGSRDVETSLRDPFGAGVSTYILDWVHAHYGVDIGQDNAKLGFDFEFMSSDTVTLNLNGVRVKEWQNSFVDPAKLKIVQFCGEITHWENDMAGSETDSCWFRNSRYLSSNWAWEPAILDTLASDATDSSQWGTRVCDGGYAGDSVAIWDKHRLPN